ncbi:SH3 domain-containing protein [Streptomyces sp. NPDC057557]|uniref:SH3 domain-containing protein n=1 Tax=Streptomyces sp. NPDC057557 TaxID=3346167 RepID=UPI0036CC0B58
MHKHLSSSRRTGRVAASAAITLLVAAGATLATVSPAAAVGTSACTNARYDWNATINTASVNFRSGPGTSYSSKGLLAKGTKHLMRCFSSSKPAGYSWSYIKVTSGPHTGVWGWVRADFSTPA